jgi:hypothetical protein
MEQPSLQLHSPAFRTTRSCLSILRTQGQRTHLSTSRRHRTPVQGIHEGNPTSTPSLTAPERSTTKTGKRARGPYSFTPPPPSRRHRRKPNPRSTRTYTSDRKETSGLHHLAKARRPSEARKTAGSPRRRRRDLSLSPLWTVARRESSRQDERLLSADQLLLVY